MTENGARLRQDHARSSGPGSTDGDGPERNAWVGWLQIGAIVMVIILALFVTARLAAGGGEDAQSPPERPPVPVRVTQPLTADHRIDLALTGTVTATAFVDLTPQVGGRVIEVSPSARAGGAFQAGELLFRIDPRDYEVALTRAQSQLADARSRFQQAEAEAEIAREEWDRLYPGQPITALAAREPQLEAARSALLAAEAQLAEARLDLERTSFSLPFAGRLTESRIEAGQLVGANQSYGTAYSHDAIELAAPIAPSDLARIGDPVGQTARVVLEAGGPSLPARVVRVGARLDARTRFIDLYLDPGEAGRALAPGLFAEILIEGPTLEDVMILPEGAVAGLDAVRRVEDGRIAEIRIDVLDRPRGRVVVRPFDAHEGLIVSPLPEGALGRPAEIVETVDPPRIDADRPVGEASRDGDRR